MAYLYGSGTKENPYQIWSLEDLIMMEDYAGCYFVLKTDIDLTSWQDRNPITNYTEGEDLLFKGNLDGGNFRILGLQGLSLFGGLYESEIKDLELFEVSVTEPSLAPSMRKSKVDNIKVTGTLNPEEPVGAIIGDMKGTSTLKNSEFSGNITKGYGLITNSYVESAEEVLDNQIYKCKVTSNIEEGAGLGYEILRTTVNLCEFRGDITVEGDGLFRRVGLSTISECEVEGIIHGSGICGVIVDGDTLIQDCEVRGSFIGPETNNYLGVVQTAGLVGMVGTETYTYNESCIQRCKVFGDVEYGAGLVGRTVGSGDRLTIDSCMFEGTIREGSGVIQEVQTYHDVSISNCIVNADIEALKWEDVAGLAGYIRSSYSEINNCHFEGTILGGDAGLVSYTHSSVRNSTAKAQIKSLPGSSRRYYDIAGLVRWIEYQGVLENCEFEGEIDVSNAPNRPWKVGGLVVIGKGQGIRNCTAKGELKSNSGTICGLVGDLLNYGSMENCGFEGSITQQEVATSYPPEAIGLAPTVGGGGSIVKNCYSRCDIISPRVSLLFRRLDDANSASYVYHTGAVTSDEVKAVFEYGESFDIEEATQPSTLFYTYDVEDIWCVKKTNQEIKDLSLESGWDFENIWDIDEETNEGFPHIRRYEDKLEYFYPEEKEDPGIENPYGPQNGTPSQGIHSLPFVGSIEGIDIGDPERVLWSSDSKRVAMTVSGEHTKVYVWDKEEGTKVINTSKMVYGIGWGVDSSTLFIMNEDEIEIWDVESEIVQGNKEIELTSPRGLACNKEGTKFAIYNTYGKIEIIDDITEESFELVNYENVLSDSMKYMEWSPSGDYLAVCRVDEKRDNNYLFPGMLDIYDVNNKELVLSIPMKNYPVRSIWSPDGEEIIAVQSTRKAVLVDVSTGRLVRKISVNSGISGSKPYISWSPDGSMITAPMSGEVVVLDSKTSITVGKSVSDNVTVSRYIGALWSPDGKLVLAFGDEDRDLWSVETLPDFSKVNLDRDKFTFKQSLNHYFEGEGLVETLHFSEDQKRLAVVTPENKLRVLVLEEGRYKLVASPEIKQEIVNVQFSPTGNLLLVASMDPPDYKDKVRIWRFTEEPKGYTEEIDSSGVNGDFPWGGEVTSVSYVGIVEMSLDDQHFITSDSRYLPDIDRNRERHHLYEIDGNTIKRKVSWLTYDTLGIYQFLEDGSILALYLSDPMDEPEPGAVEPESRVFKLKETVEEDYSFLEDMSLGMGLGFMVSKNPPRFSYLDFMTMQGSLYSIEESGPVLIFEEPMTLIQWVSRDGNILIGSKIDLMGGNFIVEMYRKETDGNYHHFTNLEGYDYLVELLMLGMVGGSTIPIQTTKTGRYLVIKSPFGDLMSILDTESLEESGEKFHFLGNFEIINKGESLLSLNRDMSIYDFDDTLEDEEEPEEPEEPDPPARRPRLVVSGGPDVGVYVVQVPK